MIFLSVTVTDSLAELYAKLRDRVDLRMSSTQRDVSTYDCAVPKTSDIVQVSVGVHLLPSVRSDQLWKWTLIAYNIHTLAYKLENL